LKVALGFYHGTNATIMETKKNPSADLTKKSEYFFSIGLFISTALAVMAFEWQQRDAFIVLDHHYDNHGEELIDIPVTKDPPPQAPVPMKINPVFVEVPQDVKEDSTFVLDPEKVRKIEQMAVVVVAPEPEEGPDIVSFPEESASPKGGFESFYKYVGERIKYPAQARRMGIEGRVFVEFIINKDGSFSDVRVVKGIGAGCDEEAARIIQAAPNWNPGKQRGKPVRQRYTLPIIFRLG
jgi:protein TonB